MSERVRNVEFDIVHLRYVVDPLLDILRLAGFLVQIEDVGAGDRDVDSL